MATSTRTARPVRRPARTARTGRDRRCAEGRRSESWCASSSSKASVRCAGWRPGVERFEIRVRRRTMRVAQRRLERQQRPAAAHRGIDAIDEPAGQLRERERGELPQPTLLHALGGRIDRRQALGRGRGRVRLCAPVLRMHHLETRRARAHLAEATQPRAARERGLLRRREMEEAQGQEAGAVRDPRQQDAAAPERDLRELYLAFDDRALAGAQAADRAHARSVLVALRQVEQQVLNGVQAQARERVGERRADAAQARHRACGERWQAVVGPSPRCRSALGTPRARTSRVRGRSRSRPRRRAAVPPRPLRRAPGTAGGRIPP